MTTSRALKDYLLGARFQQRLVRRYKRFEILAEAGLRTVIANLPRSLLWHDKRYCVVCEPHLADTNVVPDILIFKNRKPRIWIELKDTGSFNRKKAAADWEKLKTFCSKYPSVKHGYFIYVARRASQEFPVKRTRDTLHFWPIPIILEECMGCDFQEWDATYRTLAHYRVPSSG